VLSGWGGWNNRCNRVAICNRAALICNADARSREGRRVKGGKGLRGVLIKEEQTENLRSPHYRTQDLPFSSLPHVPSSGLPPPPQVYGTLRQVDAVLIAPSGRATSTSPCLLPTPPVATRFSRFRQFVERFRQNPVKIHEKIGKISQKRTK
jgi:hypothetical protein